MTAEAFLTNHVTNKAPLADVQSVLLSYFSGELTFHGTLFLGLVGLIYTYVQLGLHKRLRSKETRPLEVLVYGLVLMGIIATLVFTVGKLLYYGQFVYYTIKTTPGNVTLFSYYNAVEIAVNTSIPFGGFVEWFGGIVSIGGLFSLLCGGMLVHTLRVGSARTTAGGLLFGLVGLPILVVLLPYGPGSGSQTVILGFAYCLYAVLLVVGWFRGRAPETIGRT